MSLCPISFQIFQSEHLHAPRRVISFKSNCTGLKRGRKQKQLIYKETGKKLHTISTSLILVFNCGTSKAKPFQKYCMGKRARGFIHRIHMELYTCQMELRWKSQCCCFHKSASVCKLTTVLADSSMQNSLSSFGPKVPLAGDTTMEQEAAWLPMGCQTERTQLMLIPSHCPFWKHQAILRIRTLSGSNTYSLSSLGLYSSPWVRRFSCLHSK